MNRGNDYLTWYRVVVDRTDDVVISLAWTVAMPERPMKYAPSSCGNFPFRSHLLYERLKGQTWTPGRLS